MWFCGTTSVPKGNVSFEAWKFEVEGLKEIYDKRVAIQEMKWSLQSPGTNVIYCFCTKPIYSEIMEASGICFGEVVEKDALFSELFTIMQGEKEALIKFAGRLQSVCYRRQ